MVAYLIGRWQDLGAVHALNGDHDAAHDAWSEAEEVFGATGTREQGEMPHWRATHGCRCVGS